MKNKLKKRLTALIIATLTVVPNITAFGANKTFLDVNSDFWGYSAINKLSEKNIIDGFNDGNFKPNGTINADAFIKLVICGLGYTNFEKSIYWSTPYIQKALDLGIVKDGEFAYTEPITREGMALIISRALENEQVETMATSYVNWNEWGKANQTKYNDYQLDVTKFSKYEVFKEDGEDWLKRNYFNELMNTGRLYTLADQIKEKEAFMFFYDWYKTTASNRESLARVLELGVMSGYTDQTLKPQGTATRAEASSVILRMIDKTARVQNDFSPVSYDLKLTDILSDAQKKSFEFIGMKLPEVVIYQTNGFKWFEMRVENAKEFTNTDYTLNWKCISHSELNTFEMLQPNGEWVSLNFSEGELAIKDTIDVPVYELSKSFYTTREIAKKIDLYPGMKLTYILTVSSEKLEKALVFPITITLLDNTQVGN